MFHTHPMARRVVASTSGALSAFFATEAAEEVAR